MQLYVALSSAFRRFSRGLPFRLDRKLLPIPGKNIRKNKSENLSNLTELFTSIVWTIWRVGSWFQRNLGVAVQLCRALHSSWPSVVTIFVDPWAATHL